MNALTVLSVAALAACSSGQIIGYPGLLGYSGYPGFLPATSTVTLKSAAAPITLNTLASTPLTYNVAQAPLTYNVASVAAVAPVTPFAPVQTQYHAQDELGQYSFGFAGGPSSRFETRDVFGNVRGSYNYVDSNGKIQTQHYIADAHGFRVSGTNLPVAPEAVFAALPGPLPVPVEDTPEVAEAKEAFKKAFDKAAAGVSTAVAEPAAEDAEPAVAEEVTAARKKRAIGFSPLRFSYGFSSPLTYNYPAVVGAAPLQYTATAAAAPAITTYTHSLPALPALTTYAAAAPFPVTTYTAAAAAPRDAELLRVTNNPGHAVSYRVYP